MAHSFELKSDLSSVTGAPLMLSTSRAIPGPFPTNDESTTARALRVSEATLTAETLPTVPMMPVNVHDSMRTVSTKLVTENAPMEDPIANGGATT